MSDRELLELAGKALGIEVKFLPAWGGGVACYGDGHYWNPLTNSADALELASKLELAVCFHAEGAEISNTCIFTDALDGDRLEATRRAIVLAAAEIGEGR